MTIPGTDTIIVAARTCVEHFFKFLDNSDSKTYFSNKSTVTLHIHTYVLAVQKKGNDENERD